MKKKKKLKKTEEPYRVGVNFTSTLLMFLVITNCNFYSTTKNWITHQNKSQCKNHSIHTNTNTDLKFYEYFILLQNNSPV
jgi:hypothetical protein